MEQGVQGEHRALGQDVAVRAPGNGGSAFQDGQSAVLRPLEGVEAYGYGGFFRHGLQGPGGVPGAQLVLKRGYESGRKCEHG